MSGRAGFLLGVLTTVAAVGFWVCYGVAKGTE